MSESYHQNLRSSSLAHGQHFPKLSLQSDQNFLSFFKTTHAGCHGTSLAEVKGSHFGVTSYAPWQKLVPLTLLITLFKPFNHLWIIQFMWTCERSRSSPAQMQRVDEQLYNQPAKSLNSNTPLPLGVSSWVPPSPLCVASSPLPLSGHPWSLSATCRPSGFCGFFCGLCDLLRLAAHRLPRRSVKIKRQVQLSDLQPSGKK